MNTLRASLFSLLALLTAAPASAQVYGAPDVCVSSPLQGYTPMFPEGYSLYDADWTADGRLAVALIDRGAGNLPRTDRLVIALHDPVTGTNRHLATATFNGWASEHVSLAVPPKLFTVEGNPSLQDHERNRVYVAVGLESPVYNSSSNGFYLQRVRAVRVLSVSYTSPQPTIRLCSSANVGLTAVPYSAEPPRPEIQVYERGSGYDVECAFVDPRNTSVHGGHVMMARSSDFGATLANAFFVTGPYSAAAAAGSNPLGTSIYARPALAFDASRGRTVIALGDPISRVVRVASAAANTTAFTPVMATTAPSTEAHHSPRVAARGGLINVTYRTGSPTSSSPQPVDWFNVSFEGVSIPLPRLTTLSSAHADIELKGNTAHITIAQRESTGVTYAIDRAYRYAMRRNDPFEIPQPQRFDDSTIYLTKSVGNPAISAVTPDGASVSRTGALYTNRNFWSNSPRGHVMLEH